MTVAKKTKSSELTRSEKNRVLGGVCVGLADFFNIDPTLIRIIFVLITLFGGSGILLYLVLWLLIPSSGHASEISKASIKRGADEMKDRVEELAEEAKNYSKTKNSKYLFGITLLILGILFLFDNFGFFHFLNLWKLWPIILIILAILILSKNEN